MRVLRLLLILLLGCSAPLHAAEFGVCQAALPTSNGGTVDCTVPGFGTPAGAFTFGGIGTANGTAADHAGFWAGFYDGTNQTGMGWESTDALADSDTAFIRDPNSAVVTLSVVDQTQDGDCTLSFITDGVRFTCADAPPAAYLMNVVLVGGSGVSNVFVGSATGNATQNSTTAVSAPGFTPHIVLALAQVSATGTSGTSVRASFGIATNEGSIVQRAIGFSDTHAAAGMNTSSILSTTRLVADGVNGATFATLELTSFDANGFTVTTRDAATGPAFIYMTIRLNGLLAKLVTTAAPAGTGAQSIAGIGFRPQFGILLQGEFVAVDTKHAADNGEVVGISAFTSLASGSAGTYQEDSDGTSNTESMTDTKVCRTRKDAADYSTCTFTQWTSDGVDLSYATNVGGATQQALLVVQESALNPTRNKSIGYLP